MRPTGEASCRRRAQHLVTSSQRATIINALTTWAEVRAHMEGRGRPLPPQHVDVDSFFFGTSAGYGIVEVVGQAGQAPLGPECGQAGEGGASSGRATHAPDAGGHHRVQVPSQRPGMVSPAWVMADRHRSPALHVRSQKANNGSTGGQIVLPARCVAAAASASTRQGSLGPWPR